MAEDPLQLRLGRPDEIDRVVAIDGEAGVLYAEAGIDLAIAASHPFVRAERERWLHAALRQELHLAVTPHGEAVGFLALGSVDGALYLDQISVRPAYMRRGIGNMLLQRALQSKGSGALWLTTYAHLHWNRPFYERAGFEVVAEASCGPELLEILRLQRLWLPHPEQRVAMRG
jgi:ribosomal protein S18 acetylase RimI-like enzyme